MLFFFFTELWLNCVFPFVFLWFFFFYFCGSGIILTMVASFAFRTGSVDNFLDPSPSLLFLDFSWLWTSSDPMNLIIKLVAFALDWFSPFFIP